MLRQYFNCNEKLEIFLTCFCNILCYVGQYTEVFAVADAKTINAKIPQNFGVVKLQNFTAMLRHSFRLILF